MDTITTGTTQDTRTTVGLVEVKQLATALKRISSFVGSKNAHCTLCLLVDGQVIVSHYVQTEIVLNVPSLKIYQDTELVCVQYKDLLKIASAMKGEYPLSVDACNLYFGKSFRVDRRDALEFPFLTYGEEESRELALPACLPTLLAASGKDESRPNLHGVGIDFKEQFIGVSNGHYLIGQPFDYQPLGRGEQSATRNVTIPLDALKCFGKETVTAQLYRQTNEKGELMNDFVRLSSPTLAIVSQTGGEFPDISQIRRSNATGQQHIRVNRDDLLPVVESCIQAYTALKEERGLAGLKITGKATSIEVEYKSASGVVSGSVPATGAEGLVFGISMLYLQQVLKTQDPKMMLSVSKNAKGEVDSPIFFEGSAMEAVIMPMRIF